MDTVVTLATVPAVLALVTLLKDLGLPSKLAPLVAVLLGVVVTLVDAWAGGGFASSQEVVQSISVGVILGLSAAGLYDSAKVAGGSSKDSVS